MLMKKFIASSVDDLKLYADLFAKELYKAGTWKTLDEFLEATENEWWENLPFYDEAFLDDIWRALGEPDYGVELWEVPAFAWEVNINYEALYELVKPACETVYENMGGE